jgi:alpha-1,2-mannosyltransferase
MIPEVFGFRLLRRPEMQRAIIVVLLSVVLVYRAVQFAMLATDARWGYDFAAYWVAGHNVLAGASPYLPEQLAGPYPAEGKFLFLYPPPFAGLIAPFTAFLPADFGAVAWLWALMGVVILVATVISVAKACSLDRQGLLSGRSMLIALVLAALSLPPVIGELTVGNVHMVLLGLFALGWLGLRRGGTAGPRVAGLALGLATLIKVFPGLVLLWLLVTGRRTAFAWSVAGMALMTLVTLPITGFQPWLDYPRVVANMGAVFDVHDSVAPTLWLQPLLGFGLARTLVLLMGIAVVVYAAMRRPPMLGYAIAVTVSVLIAPAVFHHYLSVLVLPLLLAYAARVRPAILIAVYFLLWGGQQPGLGDWAWVLSRVPQSLGWLLLLCALLTVKSKRGLVDASSPQAVSPAPA